ncbi:uncharacterized protein LOC143264519 [Megachile rotundata]|uniref:uncharacterized protein LOC143264519 n=1 Tax=Megachile rotundata TaxID=143995 RepID=UPI003FD6856C
MHLPRYAKFLQFADDFAVIVTHKNRATAIGILENCIETIRQNLSALNLDLSPLKTQFLSFNSGNSSPGSLHLSINGHIIPNAQSAKFLGIHIDQHLRFDTHIHNLVKHCQRTLNVIRFLRGTWWGCDPQTLLIIYKSVIRSKIEYGLWWLFPSQKGLAAKLERLQIHAAKLALGLRFSCPNNVALAEARLPPLRARAEFLGSKYFLKVFSFSNNPICSYLEKFIELWNVSYGGSSDRRKRGEVIHSCLAYSLPLKDQLYTLHRAPCHLSDLDTQFSEINVNTSFGLHLQSSPSANLEFASFISENFPNHILIFTDGSKSDDSPSTGVAFVCSQLNKNFTLSLNPHASIYTAECAAISFAIDMAKENKDLSYLICSDSLSALQSLLAKPYTASTNPFIVRIKESLKTFNCDSNSDSSISFLWIPSHQNIEGNELADKAAKEAAQNPPSSHISIPYTDFNSVLRRRLWEQASEAWLKDSNRKGSHYFNTYFDSSKHPWFHNLCIPRFVSSWVSRYRSNHYNFGVSLKKIGVDSSSNCPCGFVDRDLNHVIWDCSLPVFQQHRRVMLRKLQLHGWKPPLTIEPFLQGVNLQAIAIFTEFLKSCGLQI